MAAIPFLGITSTYVENTGGAHRKIRKARDHLHIRGEYLGVSLLGAGVLGSPPHTWRIRLGAFSMFLFLRITSTYVENTN